MTKGNKLNPAVVVMSEMVKGKGGSVGCAAPCVGMVVMLEVLPALSCSSKVGSSVMSWGQPLSAETVMATNKSCIESLSLLLCQQVHLF